MISLFFFLAFFQEPSIKVSISNDDFDFRYLEVGRKSIYVLDPRQGRILQYDHDGKKIREFGELGPGPKEFINPNSMIEVEENKLWVRHDTGRAIQVFDDGVPQGSFRITDIFTGFFRHKDQIGLLPSATSNEIPVLNYSGKQVETLQLPEHDLTVPDGVRFKSIWQQAIWVPKDKGLAISWIWLPAFGFYDFEDNSMTIWEHDLYPVAPGMKTSKGLFPAEHTVRSMVNGPGDYVYIGACQESSLECNEILVVDIKGQAVVKAIPFKKGVAQMKWNDGVFAILNLEGDINLIDPSSL